EVDVTRFYHVDRYGMTRPTDTRALSLTPGAEHAEGPLLRDPTHNSYHSDLNSGTVDNFPSSWGSITTHFK
ncbi:hypothetical protein ABG768_018337, partial [Culter alburnus]